MTTKAKKKRQQRAQSRLALARHQQQERTRRQAAAAQRAEHQWQATLRKLATLGATLLEDRTSTAGNDRLEYIVNFQGSTADCRSRLQVQRWLKRTQRRIAEQEMSRAERHVQWMIENNCDDHGNPWPEELTSQSSQADDKEAIWRGGTSSSRNCYNSAQMDV